MGERLPRPVIQMPVAVPSLRAGIAQLASHTLRHQVATAVHNEAVAIGEWFSNGNGLVAPSTLQLVGGNMVGTLRGTIHIDDLYAVAYHICQSSDETLLQVVVRQQELGDRRRIASTGNLMLYEETVDQLRVFPDLLWHDVYRGSHS